MSTVGHYRSKMATLNLEAQSPEHQPMPGAVTTRRLEGTLVTPRVSKPVPNHIADTKIFSSSQRNGILQTKPSVIHFDGYQVGQVHQQTLQIINASRDNQQMHVIPPTTPFFSIKYSKKRSSLVPGLSLDITVQFKPKEWRYYYDCIRIHCKGEQNLLIPIHAYPILNTTKFPRHVKFPSTPIGQTRSKTVALQCDVPIEFEYQLSYLQSHPAFTVEPMNGIVPANGKVDIIITFSPAEYNTATIELQLELSQFNSIPLLCTVTGTSSPGLAADQLKQQTIKMTHQLKQQKLTLKSGTPHHLPPLMDETLKPSQKISRRKSSKTSATMTLKKEVDIVQDGYRFPVNLDNPGAIAKVLAQQPGKAKASELRQAISQTSGVTGGVASQQMKEAIFLQEIRQAVTEERANQLRWVTKLGAGTISDGEREAILNARKEAQGVYEQHHCHVSVPSKEYHRPSTECVRRRTRRKAHQYYDHNPLFDPYNNDSWSRRYMALQKFIQAARKVIIQLRIQERLKKLQALANDLKGGKLIEELLPDTSEEEPDYKKLLAQAPPFDPDTVNPCVFPKYVEEEPRDEEGNLIINGVPLKKFDVEPLVVDDFIKEEIPRFELKEPVEYKQRNYQPMRFPEFGSYRPPGLARKLKEGALEEYESLGSGIPGVDPQFLRPDAFTSLPVGTVLGIDIARGAQTEETEPSEATVKTKTSTKKSKASGVATGAVEVRVDEGEIKGSTQLPVQDIEGVGGEGETEGGVVHLKPPAELFKSPQLHPLHIFYPVPGVMSYVPMLPHSEVSEDHALLPLPTYPSSRHPQVRLNSLSVIPGLMQWKKFPSHCLAAMDGEKKLASVWKPQQSDPFSSELLPVMSKPELLSGPQLDDFADLESTEIQPVPTMEMIRSQFHLPTTAADSATPSIQLQHQNTVGDMHVLCVQDSKDGTQAKSSDTTHGAMIELGPDLRELAEESLEEERCSQMNQLGSRIQERWKAYRELLGSQGRVGLGTEEYEKQ